LNKRYLRLPLCDKIRANGEDWRRSAVDLSAIQAAFGAVHLHSHQTEVAATSKSLRPLLLNTQSSLGHPRNTSYDKNIEYISNAVRDWEHCNFFFF